MRRYGLALWALWLALSPIGLVWAYACVCDGQLRPFCCIELPAPQSACCDPETARGHGTSPATPCNDCSCHLGEAQFLPSSLVPRISLDWSGWILDAPEWTAWDICVPVSPFFGLPAIRNHSPPVEPSAPRAPPLC
ncbi:MAG: hypothetical protein N2651_02190 [Fimbriimonadales bacterium]|nr:hypothetical protein [Fimbriimonadales bacterium]